MSAAVSPDEAQLWDLLPTLAVLLSPSGELLRANAEFVRRLPGAAAARGNDWLDWLAPPARVALLDALQRRADPGLLVQVGPWEDSLFSGGRHRVNGRIWVHCFEDTEAGLNNLVRDVLKAVTQAEDDKLGGEVIVSYLNATYTPDASEGTLAAATLDIGMLWEWEHTAP